MCGRCTDTINTRNVQKIDSIKCQGGYLVVDSFRYLGDQTSIRRWVLQKCNC
uniref:Uncharacterized protein n=1 Tax=Octopus bimaculoides TaxID=37653 RepID=A0A0L8G1Y6_OCTBM